MNFYTARINDVWLFFLVLEVLEALACGLRVATSDRGSLPEVGGDAAIYFDPETPESIPEHARGFVEELSRYCGSRNST